MGSFFGAHVSDTVVSAVVTLHSPTLIPYTTYQYKTWVSSPGHPTQYGERWYFVSRPDSANGGVVVEIDYVDHGGVRIAIPARFGAHPLGTYCLDRALGEYWLPPVPPSGLIDLRMTDPAGATLIAWTKDFDLIFASTETRRRLIRTGLRFRHAQEVIPLNSRGRRLRENTAGDVRMTDLLGGTFVNVDMKVQNSVTIALPLNVLMIRARSRAWFSPSRRTAWLQIVHGSRPSSIHVEFLREVGLSGG